MPFAIGLVTAGVAGGILLAGTVARHVGQPRDHPIWKR